MKILTLLALLAVLTLSFKIQWWHRQQPVNSKPDLSMFYCGFGGDFCGQSTTNDVNNATTTVILAFVNSNVDGSVSIDGPNFPRT